MIIVLKNNSLSRVLQKKKIIEYIYFFFLYISPKAADNYNFCEFFNRRKKISSLKFFFPLLTIFGQLMNMKTTDLNLNLLPYLFIRVKN